MADRDVLILGQSARHASTPQQLVVDVAVHHLMYGSQFRKTGVDAVMRVGDEFELRFAEVGGDVRVRQWRPQTCGVRCFGKDAIGFKTQTLLLYTARETAERCGRECA